MSAPTQVGRALLLVLLALGLSIAAPTLRTEMVPTSSSISAHVEQALLPGRVEAPRTHQAPLQVALAAVVLPTAMPVRTRVTRVARCAAGTSSSGTSSRGPPGT